MKNSMKAMMLSAAVSGLLSGSAVALNAATLHTASAGGHYLGQSAAGQSDQDKDKHSCKGKNDCKGKGGCATDGSKPPEA